MPESTFIQDMKRLKTSPSGQAQKRSVKWLKGKMDVVKKERRGKTFRPGLGNMYSFTYDPKHKATLEVYDKFPLVIPIALYPDGFLGMNLHYLPNRLRMALLLKLYDFKSKLHGRVRIRATYQLLKASSKYKEFVPTLHRYLYTHMTSAAIVIPEQEWEKTVMLPTMKFKKQTRAQVYRNSMSKI